VSPWCIYPRGGPHGLLIGGGRAGPRRSVSPSAGALCFRLLPGRYRQRLGVAATLRMRGLSQEEPHTLMTRLPKAPGLPALGPSLLTAARSFPKNPRRRYIRARLGALRPLFG
jgi:hypothetical protein